MRKKIKTAQKSMLIGKPLKIPNISIYELFQRRSKINANKTICRCHEDKLTVLQLQAESEIYAKAFMALGVKCGDIVPLCVEPSCTAVTLFFALNRIGAVSTFLNATAGTEEIKKYILRFNSNIFVYSDKLKLNIRVLREECGLKKSIKIIRSNTYTKYSSPSKQTSASFQNSNFDDTLVSLDQIHRLGQESSLTLPHNCGSDSPAFIAYTSGTTGEPKSILLSNGNIIAEMLSLKKTTHMQYGPQGNSLQVVPFNILTDL